MLQQLLTARQIMVWDYDIPPHKPGHPAYEASVRHAKRAQRYDRMRDHLCLECGYPLELGRCTDTECHYPEVSTRKDPRR